MSAWPRPCKSYGHGAGFACYRCVLVVSGCAGWSVLLQARAFYARFFRSFRAESSFLFKTHRAVQSVGLLWAIVGEVASGNHSSPDSGQAPFSPPFAQVGLS